MLMSRCESRPTSCLATCVIWPTFLFLQLFPYPCARFTLSWYIGSDERHDGSCLLLLGHLCWVSQFPFNPTYDADGLSMGDRSATTTQITHEIGHRENGYPLKNSLVGIKYFSGLFLFVKLKWQFMQYFTKIYWHFNEVMLYCCYWCGKLNCEGVR